MVITGQNGLRTRGREIDERAKPASNLSGRASVFSDLRFSCSALSTRSVRNDGGPCHDYGYCVVDGRDCFGRRQTLLESWLTR